MHAYTVGSTLTQVFIKVGVVVEECKKTVHPKEASQAGNIQTSGFIWERLDLDTGKNCSVYSNEGIYSPESKRKHPVLFRKGCISTV
jgi:hypothetical protein